MRCRFHVCKEYGDDFALLKISSYPFPENILKDFVEGLEEVWVLEEGEPIVEEIVRKYFPSVKGKLSGDLAREGELGPDALASYVWGMPPLKLTTRICLNDRLSCVLAAPTGNSISTGRGRSFFYSRRHRLLHTRQRPPPKGHGFMPLHGRKHQ